MRRKWAFTLIELLVVISIIALLIGILLPALGAARRTARQMQNSTQVRGIGQGAILFSQGNGSYFPGLDTTGKSVGSVAGTTTNYGYTSNNAQATFAILMNGNYFVPTYGISPGETNIANITTKAMAASTNADTTTYSYCVSQANTTGTAGNAATNTGRAAEWKDNTNTQAVVVSDRILSGSTGAEQVGAADPTNIASCRSIWTTTDGDWRGSVVFGDNSTAFMTTLIVTTTKYGTVTNSGENIFVNTDGADSLYNARQWRQ